MILGRGTVEAAQVAARLLDLGIAPGNVGVHQQHDPGSGNIRICRAGVVEAPHETFHFIVPAPQRRHLDVAAVGYRECMGIGISRRDPQRRIGLLHRVRCAGSGGEIPAITFVSVISVPELSERRHELAQFCAGPHCIDTVGKARVLEAIGATGHADVEPSAGDDVGHGRFAGELDGMPERRHYGARAEPDALGLRRQVGDIDEWIRRDGELHAMVLANPGRLETARLRSFNELRQLVENLRMRNRWLVTLHMGEQ
jgi:hypothetical protein